MTEKEPLPHTSSAQHSPGSFVTGVHHGPVNVVQRLCRSRHEALRALATRRAVISLIALAATLGAAVGTSRAGDQPAQAQPTPGPPTTPASSSPPHQNPADQPGTLTNAGQGNAVPGNAWPGNAGPGNAELANAGPGNAGPGNAELANAGPGNAGPGNAGRGEAGPPRVAPATAPDGRRDGHTGRPSRGDRPGPAVTTTPPRGNPQAPRVTPTPTLRPEPPPEREETMELSLTRGTGSREVDYWGAAPRGAGGINMTATALTTNGRAHLAPVPRADWRTCSTLTSGWTDIVAYADLRKGSELCVQSPEGRLGWIRILGLPTVTAPTLGLHGFTWDTHAVG